MTSPLTYAPHLPWHKSPRLRRRLIFTVSLLLITTSVYFLGPRLYRRLLFLYYQHQCLTHTYPPGTIALDLPALAPGTLTFFPSTAPAFPPPAPVSFPYFSGTTWPPPPWRKLAEHLNHDSFFPLYSDLEIELAFSVAEQHPLFLHRLTSPAGDRLVLAFAVPQVYGQFPDDLRPASIDATVIIPGNFSGDPSSAARNSSSLVRTALFIPLHETDSLRIYTAQSDPTDPASFTLTFDLNASPHTARFTLAPAGDHISLASLTPPL